MRTDAKTVSRKFQENETKNNKLLEHETNMELDMAREILYTESSLST